LEWIHSKLLGKNTSPGMKASAPDEHVDLFFRVIAPAIPATPPLRP
jgi:hypothetical protein